jgi:hypothetical protein
MMGCTEYTMFVLTVHMSRPRDALQQFAYGTGIRIVYTNIQYVSVTADKEIYKYIIQMKSL